MFDGFNGKVSGKYVGNSWRSNGPGLINICRGKRPNTHHRQFPLFWNCNSSPVPPSSGLLLVNLGFLNFRFSDFRFSRLFCKIFLKNMLVRYRGINNKGVLERPWTKWRVLMAISTTLKCQFTGQFWKVDFLTPCTTKSAETLQVGPYSRCGPPGNP